MTYYNGALRCNRLLCAAAVVHWAPKLAREDARATGWHVAPCDCEWRADYPDREWKHDGDYCPEHFPQKPRGVQAVNSPLL